MAHVDPFRTYTFLVVGFVAGHAGREAKGMRLCQCCGQCLLPESQSSDCDRRPCLEVGHTVLPALRLPGFILGRSDRVSIFHETYSWSMMSACNVELATLQPWLIYLQRDAQFPHIRQPILPVFGSLDAPQLRPMAGSTCVALPRGHTQ